MARNFSPWAYWQLRLAGARSPASPPADIGAADAWRAHNRARLAALLGADPDPVPLGFEVLDSVDCEHYRRDTVVFDTETAMSVPAFLLVPHTRDGAAPGAAVLAIHGHGAGKSMVCDVDGGDPQRRAEIAGYNGAYGHELAWRGFVVLAPDLRCFGARQDPQWDPSSHRYDCDWNLVCAVMAGTNPIAQNIWDLRRSLDVLAAHPLVDPLRIGACGLSYGGTMTLFLAAVDERVRAAVVSGYLSSWAAAHRVPWNMCGSQVMWGQLGELEHLDIAALVAPRARSSSRPAPTISSSRSARRARRSRHSAMCMSCSTPARASSTTSSTARTRGMECGRMTFSPSISEPGRDATRGRRGACAGQVVATRKSSPLDGRRPSDRPRKYRARSWFDETCSARANPVARARVSISSGAYRLMNGVPDRRAPSCAAS